jgi:CheY-like chemotaxis protein
MHPARRILIASDDKAEAPVLACVLRHHQPTPRSCFYQVSEVIGAEQALLALRGQKCFNLLIALCPLRKLGYVLAAAQDADPRMGRLVLADKAAADLDVLGADVVLRGADMATIAWQIAVLVRAKPGPHKRPIGPELPTVAGMLARAVS